MQPFWAFRTDVFMVFTVQHMWHVSFILWVDMFTLMPNFFFFFKYFATFPKWKHFKKKKKVFVLPYSDTDICERGFFAVWAEVFIGTILGYIRLFNHFLLHFLEVGWTKLRNSAIVFYLMFYGVHCDHYKT